MRYGLAVLIYNSGRFGLPLPFSADGYSYATGHIYTVSIEPSSEYDTIFQGADLNGGRWNTLSTQRLGRQPYMVDSIGTEVFQEVGADGGWYGDMYASPLHRVIVVQLVRYDAVTPARWVVPTQLNVAGGHRNAL